MGALSDVLVFGPQRPRWQVAESPEGRPTVVVSGTYRTDLGALRGAANANLSWLYLLQHTTTPSGLPLARCHDSFRHVDGPVDLDEHEARRAWAHLVDLLGHECRSGPQRQVLKKIAEQQLQCSATAAELWSQPALIPECWVNVQPPPAASDGEAEGREHAPFRVDLLLRAENYSRGADQPLTAVIEIDSPVHFKDEETLVRTTAKSRYLMRQGWRYFRFQVAEIDRLSPQDLYSETEPHGPDDIEL